MIASDNKSRSCCPLLTAKTAKNPAVRQESPATKPSIPSSMFMELVIKVIKQAVISQLIQSMEKKVNVIPEKYINMNEKSRWESILFRALILISASSIKPKTTKRKPKRRTDHNSRWFGK